MSTLGYWSIGNRRKLKMPSTTSSAIILVLKTGRLIATPLRPPPPPLLATVLLLPWCGIRSWLRRGGRAPDLHARAFLDRRGRDDDDLTRLQAFRHRDHA